MKTFKKLFSVSAIVALLGTLAPMYAFAAGNSLDGDPEFPEAYAYAYKYGITTQSEDNVNMGGNLNRIAMAKMIAQYAINVLGMKVPETAENCTFVDVTAALDAQYDEGVTNACKLGLMGQNMPGNKFRPDDNVTRAEFGTTLSRALNHDSDNLAEMNAATPYYKDHLNFLNEKGIMKNISDPTMQERRGYVMIMMMRADDSYVPAKGCEQEEILSCLAKSLAGEVDYDACKAACSDENADEDLVHKSGTLNVSVTANNGAQAVLDGVSELDTINLNASEAINVEKVTLEKYGYTKNDGIKVWLENTDGVVISNEKTFTNTKDTVDLTIKKDYRDATETKNYVIVTEITSGLGGSCSDNTSTTEAACLAAGSCVDSTNAPVAAATTETSCLATAGNVWTPTNTWTAGTVYHTAGETVGFKVTDVLSSAETLKIASYTPTTYNTAVYNSSNVTVTMKGKTMTYNYTEGESYQVAKIRVQAGNAEISVNGITINTAGANTLDLKRFVDKVEVLGDDGIALKLSATDIKNDSIKVTFPAQTIAAKKNADFTILLKLKDFDQFGQIAQFTMANDGLAAIETKTSTRVSATVTPTLYSYTFEGSKIKVTNKNLGNVSAAKGANDVVVAEGTIELSEAVELNSFTITPTGAGVESLELWLNGSLVEEATLTAGAFVFPKTLIEKSGKLQFVADIDDNAANGTVTFSPFNKAAVSDGTNVGKYDESGKWVIEDNFAGAITFSRLNIEAAKGNLENTISKKVEVIADGTATKKVVFDGTYTANKGDVYLNELVITDTTPTKLTTADESITFYVYINGEPVADTTINDTATTTVNETFSDVLVKKGETATIKVEAEVEAYTANKNYVYSLQLKGEDVDGAAINPSTENMTTISFVSAGSVTVVASTSDDVILQASNVELAKFTVKSNLEGTKLTSFEISGLGALDANKVKVVVDGATLTMGPTEDYTITSSKIETVANAISTDIDSDGVVVEVSYKGEIPTGTYNVKLDKVNTSTINKTFTKYVVPALVKVTAQENMGDTTKYTFSVEKYDESYEVSALKLYVNGTPTTIGNVSDGQTEELNNNTVSAAFIDQIDYTVSTATPFNAVIQKSTYKDFFRIGTSFLKVFKAQD